VPLLRRDFGFFDRQRDLFSKWVKEFDDDWHSMGSDESLTRFDLELEQLRKDLFQLEPDPSMLHVENPFVTDACGNRKLSLRFDCSKFKPEEVTVKTIGDKLCVHAKHTARNPADVRYIGNLEESMFYRKKLMCTN